MMLAWHFLSKDKRLGYGDGRVVEVGVPLECEGDPALCESGMHGSVRLIDALRYASGPIVCRVEIEGDIIEGADKVCGRRRTVLWWIDATRILHEFACQCAEDALALIDNPDSRSVAAVDAKRRWMAGEITDEELAVARSAAGAAAAADARDASRDAARWAAAAALDAAWWYAAWCAAAARSAAWSAAAARAAAGAQQDARLTSMVTAAHEKDETK